MRLLFHWPLRYVLLGILCSFALLCGTGTYVMTMAQARHQVARQASDELQARLHRLQVTLSLLARMGHLEGVRSVLSSFEADPNHEFSVLTAANGIVIAATRPAMLGATWTTIAPEGDPAHLVHNQAHAGVVVQRTPDGQGLMGFVEVCGDEPMPQAPKACGFLHTHQNFTHATRVAMQAIRLQALAHGGGLLVVAGVAWGVLHGLVTRRAERLIATAQRIAGGDHSAQTGLRGHDELAQAGQAMDTMTQTLATSLAAHAAMATDNARLFDAVQAREARIRAVVETAVEGIITINAQGIVETYNAAAERLFGYPAAAVIGQNVRMLMPAPYHDEHDAYLQRYLDTGVRQIIGTGRDVVGRRCDGTTFPMHLAVSEMVVDGQRMFTGLVSDISAQKAAEAALHEANEALEQRVAARTAALAEANEEVKRFAYIVSHDLRAPLVNLKGFAGELRLSQDTLSTVLAPVWPHLSPQQTADLHHVLQQDIPEALGFIDASVTRMDALVRAILQLSRLGRRDLYIEELDMVALMQETVHAMAHQVAERQVQVTIGALPTVRADRTAMAQVLGNLFGNAVAYLEPGRAGVIAVSGARQDDATAFTISDNGRGIAQDDIPKIFEPFRRVGRQDVPGEGMGLAYVRALVRRHGGELTCQSSLGAGTTFTWTIAHVLPESEPYG